MTREGCVICAAFILITHRLFCIHLVVCHWNRLELVQNTHDCGIWTHILQSASTNWKPQHFVNRIVFCPIVRAVTKDWTATGFEQGSRINMFNFSDFQMKGNIQTSALELSSPRAGWLKQWWICVQMVAASNPGRDIDYPYWNISWVFTTHSGKFRAFTPHYDWPASIHWNLLQIFCLFCKRRTISADQKQSTLHRH